MEFHRLPEVTQLWCEGQGGAVVLMAQAGSLGEALVSGQGPGEPPG